MANYMIYSQNQNICVKYFEKFDKEQIKISLIELLNKDNTDILEFCKEPSGKDLRKFYGYEILDYFALNKKGELCKIITKNNKEYLKKVN